MARRGRRGPWRASFRSRTRPPGRAAAQRGWREMSDREFTLEEARIALAAARPAFEELRGLQGQIGSLSAELAEAREQHRGNGRGHGPHERSLAGRVAMLRERARRLLAEVEATGAELKGLEQGLLDFPATIEGAPAYWCWQAGEPEIAWWHPRESGFAGRRRIEE